MKSLHGLPSLLPPRSRGGFSYVEVTVAVVIVAILASIGLAMVSKTRVSVIDTKLRTDVTKLNQIISLYLGDGGSLDSATTAQEVLDKLKTVRTNADAKRQVGALTGRGVDVRLTARMQTSAERASTSPRALWNASTKRFDIVTTQNLAGIADFVLDDSLLTVNYPTETRTRTTMLYNGNNGWVWIEGTNTAAGFLSPIDKMPPASTENLFDPTVPPVTSTTTTSGSTTSGTTTSGTTTSGTTTSGTTTSGTTTSGTTTSGTTTSGTTTSGTTTSGSTTGTTVTTLPKPINTPNGGTYTTANWPATITINSNGAPATGSTLKYRINGGSWITYTSGFTINSGDKVESKNFSDLPLVYADGSIDSDTYYKLIANFTGTTVPTWTNVSGGPNLVKTISNTDPNSVVLSHGDTRLDLGGGEYLDAGVENTLTFNRVSPFSNVPANTDFALGEFVILNGTTFNDSEATSATLNIALSLTQPVTQSGNVALSLSMVSTANSSDRLASADTVTINNPTTSFTVTTGGVTYTLQVRLVSLDTDNGVVSGNTLYIYEGASARAALVGKFVSNK